MINRAWRTAPLPLPLMATMMAVLCWSMSACSQSPPDELPDERPDDSAIQEAGGLVIDLGDGVTMRLVKVKPGVFRMGSPAGEPERVFDEAQREVTLTEAYWLGETEVTHAEWQAVMGTALHQDGEILQNPVERVSWFDAVEFCNRLTELANGRDPTLNLTACYRLTDVKYEGGRITSAEVEVVEKADGYRLPTEAEWEHACRAGAATAYSFGADASLLGDYAWIETNSGGAAKPVASKKPNAWGFYDMHGNVVEWCSDWYGAYQDGAVFDPQGPSSGSARVLRGGSSRDYFGYARSASRLSTGPENRGGDYGFRVARTAFADGGLPPLESEPLPRPDDVAFNTGGGLVVDIGESGVSIRLVQIKPGSFLMGSPVGELNRDADEAQRVVKISRAFWLGETEVTQAQWASLMGTSPSAFEDQSDHPVEQVSWNDALAFCERLSDATGLPFRLPTEAEWEYACRAGTTTPYSFGRDAGGIESYAWIKSNSGSSTKQVASQRPNRWGLYDMHGNVWEWCSDWYGAYLLDDTSDPQGPPSGDRRVMRGGSWANDAQKCRSARRSDFRPDRGLRDMGFRVAMNVVPAEASPPESEATNEPNPGDDEAQRDDGDPAAVEKQ